MFSHWSEGCFTDRWFSQFLLSAYWTDTWKAQGAKLFFMKICIASSFGSGLGFSSRLLTFLIAVRMLMDFLNHGNVDVWKLH